MDLNFACISQEINAFSKTPLVQDQLWCACNRDKSPLEGTHSLSMSQTHTSAVCQKRPTLCMEAQSIYINRWIRICRFFSSANNTSLSLLDRHQWKWCTCGKVKYGGFPFVSFVNNTEPSPLGEFAVIHHCVIFIITRRGREIKGFNCLTLQQLSCWPWGHAGDFMFWRNGHLTSHSATWGNQLWLG